MLTSASPWPPSKDQCTTTDSADLSPKSDTLIAALKSLKSTQRDHKSNPQRFSIPLLWPWEKKIPHSHEPFNISTISPTPPDTSGTILEASSCCRNRRESITGKSSPILGHLFHFPLRLLCSKKYKTKTVANRRWCLDSILKVCTQVSPYFSSGTDNKCLNRWLQCPPSPLYPIGNWRLLQGFMGLI